MSEKFPKPISEKSPKNKATTRRKFLEKSLKGLAGLILAGQLPKEVFAGLSQESKEKLEELIQKSYYEDYAKENLILYGDRLYTNSELLDTKFIPDQKIFYEYYLKEYPDSASYFFTPPRIVFRLTPWLRLLQYFLRNGRERTFESAEKLGCKHHETLFDDSHPLTSLYAEAGISIKGEKIDWLEVPDSIISGGMYRDGDKYGGETETVMQVEAFDGKLDDWVQIPAQKAGYKVDIKQEFEGEIANEMTHEILHKYFRKLFDEGYSYYERLDEPFKSFKTEVPGLQFKNNAQASEFLSDVSDWIVGGKNGVYFRFFNPLYNMDPKGRYYQISKTQPEKNNYWYSYQVQKYAMEQVLIQKGYKNPKTIIDKLIQEAEESYYKNHDELFVSARKYFKEDDFEKIAQIYRKIGIELLKKMKPYFSKPKK